MFSHFFIERPIFAAVLSLVVAWILFVPPALTLHLQNGEQAFMLLLWLVIAVRSAPPDFAILCWRSNGSRVRVASLICSRDHVVQSDAG